MRMLLATTTVIEVGAGAALLCLPSATVAILLGSGLDTPVAVALWRVAGTALLALGLACGLAYCDAQSRAARGLVIAMTLYNLGVAAILSAAGTQVRPVGVALWPAVALHAALAVWCVKCFPAKPSHGAKKAK